MRSGRLAGRRFRVGPLVLVVGLVVLLQAGSAQAAPPAVGTISNYASAGITGAPQYVTLGPDGADWFTASGVVGRVSRGGTIKTYTSGTFGGLQGIATGPDGALWFVDGTQ